MNVSRQSTGCDRSGSGGATYQERNATIVNTKYLIIFIMVIVKVKRVSFIQSDYDVPCRRGRGGHGKQAGDILLSDPRSKKVVLLKSTLYLHAMI